MTAARENLLRGAEAVLDAIAFRAVRGARTERELLMRAFTPRPKATQQTTAGRFPGRAHLAQSQELSSILALRARIGNRALQRMLQTVAREPEAVADPLEREADRIADELISKPAPAAAASAGATKDGMGQTRAGGGAEVVMPTRDSVQQALHSAGEPMDASTRAYFEPRFGRDLSGVRLHFGVAANESAQNVNAQAYTVGHDIVFGAGRFEPGTREGQRLLAHELVHVVQQSSRDRSGGTDHAHGLSVSSPIGPQIQRRLRVTPDPGSRARIPALFKLLEAASGLSLAYDPKTGEVSIARVRAVTSPVLPGETKLPSHRVGKSDSPVLATELRAIILDVSNDAVLNLGGSPIINSFGTFNDALIQEIDFDGLVKLEAGAPGSGVALLFHQIVMNFSAHASGADPEKAGVEAEGRVASELVLPGKRVAEVIVDKDKGFFRQAYDYESYFLVFDRGPTGVVFSSQVPRVHVDTFEIGGFVPNSKAWPTGAKPEAHKTAVAMRMNELATVRIECGGTDAEERAGRLMNAILAHGKSDPATNFMFGFRGEKDFHRVVNTGLPKDKAVITLERPDVKPFQFPKSPPKPAQPRPDWQPTR